ncbi:hypothetical protein FOA52_009076 [Chlamydomonas sp. UWO 241]|nr:hypothetical protein FOA52_009076 [Chlamydomonas sp. UWO 241]
MEAPSSSSGQPAASGISLDPEPWKLLGRDTPAGKALFKLYGGTTGAKVAGQGYHERNKAVQQRKVEAGWTPKPLAPEKVEVARPQLWKSR